MPEAQITRSAERVWNDVPFACRNRLKQILRPLGMPPEGRLKKILQAMRLYDDMRIYSMTRTGAILFIAIDVCFDVTPRLCTARSI